MAKARSKVAKIMRGDMPATADKPPPSKNIGIRRIDNGYVISESGYGKDGRYFNRERFSKTEPSVDIED